MRHLRWRVLTGNDSRDDCSVRIDLNREVVVRKGELHLQQHVGALIQRRSAKHFDEALSTIVTRKQMDVRIGTGDRGFMRHPNQPNEARKSKR